MAPLTAKLAFLHAAHDFATTPSAVNWRTLETAMQIHQRAMYPSLQDALATQVSNGWHASVLASGDAGLEDFA